MRGAHGRTRRGPRGSVCGGLRLPRVFVCLTASHRPTERAPGRESVESLPPGGRGGSRCAAPWEGQWAKPPRVRHAAPARQRWQTSRRRTADMLVAGAPLRARSLGHPWSPGFPSARGLLAQGDASNAPHTQEPLHSALTADRRFGRLQKNRSSVLEMRPNSIFFQNSYQELQCNFDF